jgi:hypothetical protein
MNLLPSLLLSLAAATPAPELVERQVLPQVPRAVVVDALLGRVELTGLTKAQVEALAKRSALCPRTETHGTRSALLCTTRSLTAVVDGTNLVLRTARYPTDGLTPDVAYTDKVFGLGTGSCPGDTPSLRGECAFVAGDVLTAALELKTAYKVGGPFSGHAAVRLGDLAWKAKDAEAAAHWYNRAGAGLFGRIAATRLCELIGCLDGPSDRMTFDAFDDTALPKGVQAEFLLRRTRALYVAGRTDDAVRALSRWPESCRYAATLCRKIATGALRERQGRDAPEALALALRIPNAFDGAGAADLAAVVVPFTDRLAAPLFGANVLAATSSQVDDAELDAWILQSAERYVLAGDAARGDAVLSFAKSRGFVAGRERARWRAVTNALKALAAGDPATTTTTTTTATTKAKAKSTTTTSTPAHDTSHAKAEQKS